MIRIKTISKMIICGYLIGMVFTFSTWGKEGHEPNYVELFIKGRRELNRLHEPYGSLNRLYFTTQVPVLDDPNAISFLTGILRDGPNWEKNDHLARCYAAMCLGATKDKRALQPLLEALEYYDPNEEREFVANYAASALALLGDTNAIQPLVATLEDSNKPSMVKYTIMNTLIELDGSKAFEPIADAINKDKSCTYGAIQALETLGDVRAVGPIMAVLEENKPYWKEKVEERSNLPVDSENSETKRAILKSQQRKLGAKLEMVRLSKSLSKITKVNINYDDPNKIPELWSQWWRGGPQFTRARLEAKHSEWKAMKKENQLEKSNANSKLSEMTDLGIPAIPFMVEKVKQGETDFIPLISKLTDKKLAETATKEQCLAWWEANKQKWLIPFPEPNALPADPNK